MENKQVIVGFSIRLLERHPKNSVFLVEIAIFLGILRQVAFALLPPGLDKIADEPS